MIIQYRCTVLVTCYVVTFRPSEFWAKSCQAAGPGAVLVTLSTLSSGHGVTQVTNQLLKMNSLCCKIAVLVEFAAATSLEGRLRLLCPLHVMKMTLER